MPEMWDSLMQSLPAIQQGAQSLSRGLEAASGYLGIPPGDTRNSQGQVVFPTNAFERGLQSSDSAAQSYAANFVGPGKAPRAAASLEILQPYLEGKMGEYAQGKLPARDLHKEFNAHGWTIDNSGSYSLRGNRSELRVFDPAGKEHFFSF
jgi:hypothetical protein